jgi:hypothetical protein
VIRRSPRRRSTAVPNILVNDNSLSFKAKGIAVYILSKPDTWRIDAASLARIAGPDGRAAILAGLAELEASGYLVRRRHQGPDGKWSSSSTLYESPEDAADDSEPKCGFPTSVFPTSGYPTSDNPTSFLSPVREKTKRGVVARPRPANYLDFVDDPAHPLVIRQKVNLVIDEAEARSTERFTPKERRTLAGWLPAAIEAGYVTDALIAAVQAAPWKSEASVMGELRKSRQKRTSVGSRIVDEASEWVRGEPA